MEESAKGGKPPSQWLRNNLVAVGAAAVLTVYSAGYFRTREAAQRFAGEAAQRRTAAPSSPRTGARVAAPVEAGPAVTGKSGGGPATPSKPATTVPAAASKPPAEPPRSAPPRSPDPAIASGPAVVSAPSIASAPTVAAASAAAPATAPAAPPPATSATVADSAATDPKQNRSESNQWKDGTYYGWGTSRHGDIQASVEIKDGRIAGAYISQCLTRYSCSWISMLPPQVVQRQSAEVDYVSGATQSSDAFYYAVLEALKQAK
jgi:uncharacterized protein with FMN-binding domain